MMHMIWFVVELVQSRYMLIFIVGLGRVQPKGHGGDSLGHSRTIPQRLQNCKGAWCGHFDRRSLECQEVYHSKCALLNKE